MSNPSSTPSLTESGGAGATNPNWPREGLPKCMYLGGECLPAIAKTGIWRGLQAKGTVLLEMPAKFKYQSKWYGNPLALTIYVNANEL